MSNSSAIKNRNKAQANKNIIPKSLLNTSINKTKGKKSASKILNNRSINSLVSCKKNSPKIPIPIPIQKNSSTKKNLSVIYSASQHSDDIKNECKKTKLSSEIISDQNSQINESEKKIKVINQILTNRSYENCNTKIKQLRSSGSVLNFQFCVEQLRKLPSSPFLDSIIEHLILTENSYKSRIQSMQQRYTILERKYKKTIQDNEIYVSFMDLMKFHWDELVKNQQVIVKNNFNLAEKLEKSEEQVRRIAEIEKQNQYLKYLILTANKKYQQLKSQKEERIQILSKTFSLKESNQILSQLRDLFIKLFKGKENNIEDVLKEILNARKGHENQDQICNNSEVEKQNKVSEAFVKNKKNKQMQKEKQKVFDMKQNYRKFLFK